MEIATVELIRLLGSWRSAGPTLPTALADCLTGLILDGRLPVNTRLPAERVLAGALRISRVTVVAALAELRSRECLSTAHGAGSTIRLPAHTTVESITAWASVTPPVWAAPALIDWSAATPAAPPAAVLRAYQQALARLPFSGTGYSSGGLLELRAAIADRYTNRGLPTHPDQICVTAGAQQALSLLIDHTVRPRDRVLLETPTYPGILDILRSKRARPACVPVEDTWSLTTLSAGLDDPAIRLTYLMPGLHNPTGQIMSSDQQEATCRATARPGPPVVLDDTLADLAPPGSHGPLTTQDTARLVRVGSLSKTVWGGLRVGWVRSDRATTQLLAHARTRADLGTPVLEQLAAIAVLAEYDDILITRRRDLHDAVTQLTDALARRVPPVTVLTRTAGPSLWCRLPSGISSRALTAAAQRRGLRLIDTANFSPHGLLPSHLRLPVDVPQHTLPEAVDRLALALQDSTKRPRATSPDVA